VDHVEAARWDPPPAKNRVSNLQILKKLSTSQPLAITKSASESTEIRES